MGPDSLATAQVVIGAFGWSGYRGNGRDIPDSLRGQLLAWADARPHLDYAYSAGFGAPDCHAVTIWTDDKVIWITQYDGSTSMDSVPRNPTAFVPSMPGG